MLNSAIAAYYYLRVIVYMYMREPEGAPATYAPSFAGGLALAVALVGIVRLGLMPGPFTDLAQSRSLHCFARKSFLLTNASATYDLATASRRC